jgi:archaellum component FlaC
MTPEERYDRIDQILANVADRHEALAKRHEALTERHEALTERHEALTQSVELIARQSAENERQLNQQRRTTAEHELMFAQIALRFQDTRENIDGLVRVAEASQERITRIEEDLDALIRAITAQHGNGKGGEEQ